MSNLINMERRTFIKKSIIGGIGLVILPSVVWANQSNFQYLAIGNVNIHHRHGNLFASTFHKINHHTIKEICRDVFYKNGTSPSEDDAFRVVINLKTGVQKAFFITPNETSTYFNFEDLTILFSKKGDLAIQKGDLVLPISEGVKGYISAADQNINLKKPYMVIKSKC